MIEISDDILRWIDEHRNEDVVKLRLRYHKLMTPELDFAILQIECRKKAAKKLSETLSNQRFMFPTALSSEQCTSDLLAKYHATLIRQGDRVIDLTSGLGIDVFHMASIASHVTAVEMSPNVADAIEYNAGVLGFENIDAVNADCRYFINATTERFDIAFIDPARRGEGGKRLFALADCEPDITSMLGDISRKCDKLIVKASPMLDVSQVLRELPGTSDVYIIGTHRECKEIVVVANFNESVNETRIHAVTMQGESVFSLDYTLSEEVNAAAEYAMPLAGAYLYEPYPALMKAAPVKLLSERYGVGKLHQNTHLYVSTEIIEDFLGEIFSIEEIIPFSSKEIKVFKEKYPQINVATRNFILSADELKKKLKVKDGGYKRVFGCTTSDGQRVLIVASPI